MLTRLVCPCLLITGLLLELWRTQAGVQWQQINTDGFGNRTNEWIVWGNATTVFKDALYVGVTNYATGAWSLLTRNSPLSHCR